MKQLRIPHLLILLFTTVINVIPQSKLPGEAPPKWVSNLDNFVDVPTPTAASLGNYGNIGVSYYTGRPNIGIPLYNLKVRGLVLPIALDYDASGVMPNSLPTWVGQNWTLNVGGVITRTRHGNFDEWEAPQGVRDVSLGISYNYFKCHDKLVTLLNKPGDNYHELKNSLDYFLYDFSPDEFSFNFMGKNGKFFLDSNGNWVVQSKDNLEVILDINKPSNFISPFYPKYANKNLQPKNIAGFILRDENGYEYHFGYNQNAIEYTTSFWRMSVSEYNESWHAMSWYLSKITDKYGNVLFSLDYERGEYIIQAFNCSYAEGIYAKSTGMLGNTEYRSNTNKFPYSFSINSPVYLKRIETLSGLIIVFSSSFMDDEMGIEKLYKKLYNTYGGVSGLYQELAHNVSGWVVSGDEKVPLPSKRGFYYLQEDDDSLYRFRHNPPSFFNRGRYLPQGRDRDIREDLLSYSRLRKLNSVTIRQCGNHNIANSVSYRFCTSIVNRRFRLDSLLVQDDITGNVKNKYQFKYNKFEDLPEDYLTKAVDHWGYYNGRSYSRNNGQLETVRNPNFEFTQVGVLNKIIYPTGGCSVMEYEPNIYGMKLKPDRQVLEKESGIGGGLRIRSIRTYASDSMEKLTGERVFTYNIPGTSVSSGELFASPLYRWDYKIKCEQSNATYYMGVSHDASIIRLANNTSPSLGYSYVTETIKNIESPGKNLESHVYHFSNLSTKGTQDQPFILTFGYTDIMTPDDEFSDMGFKRGLLLNEDTYNSEGRKVHSIGFKYRTDESDYLKQFVLTSNLRYECPTWSADFAHYVGGVYKLYYPKYDIVEQQDTVFPTDGSAPITTIRKMSKADRVYTSWYPYKHDVNIRLTLGESSERANNTENYQYGFGSFTQCSRTDSLLYKKMFCITPLTITCQRNGRRVSVISTKYVESAVRGAVVPSVVTRTNQDNRTDTLVKYISYTATGAPLIYKETGKPETYLKWAYHDCYLLLRSNTYIPISFTDDEFLDTKVYMPKLQQYVRTASAGTIAYAYDMLYGLTAVMYPNGNMTTYRYNRFGDLQSVYDHNGKLLKEYQYNYRK